MGSQTSFDSAACERLLPAVLRGDDLAWNALVLRLAPELESIIRRSRAMVALRDSVDHRRDVMTRSLERLHAGGFRALRRFAGWREAHPDRTFRDWLTIVCTNVARDYVSQRLGESKAAPGGRRLVDSLAITLAGLEGDVGFRPAMTDEQTARELLDYAARHLPADQIEALARWLRGEDGGEIARALGLSNRAAADRLVRAALARLRRRFAAGAA